MDCVRTWERLAWKQAACGVQAVFIVLSPQTRPEHITDGLGPFTLGRVSRGHEAPTGSSALAEVGLKEEFGRIISEFILPTARLL